MTSKTILVVTCVSLAVLIGCGDDDTPDLDAGPDASDDASVTDSGNESGSGGRGGRGGNGGSGGAAGSAGAGAGGSGGSGGAAGGAGGSGGSGGGGGGGVATYTVGGSVTGLAGSGLKLKNNGGDELTVSGSMFEFSPPLASGGDYAVTVSAQPSNPTQTCTVTNGTGKVGSEDVDDVVVTCVTSKFSVKGTLGNYRGSDLVLQNNGGDPQTILSGATTLEFPMKLDSGASYAVTVATQPPTQTCAVSMGNGQVGAGDVTSVRVDCYEVLQIEPGLGSAIASWINTGATSYTLKWTTAANCDFETTTCPGFGQFMDPAATSHTVLGLTNGIPYYFQLTADYGGGSKSLSKRTAARPNVPRYDGEVYAVATAASGTTYVGGTFTRLSVHTGAAVPLHKTTGFPSEMPDFPIVDADVYSVAHDGSGGYYIGGAAGLQHIKSDGTVDLMWNLAVTGNSAIVHTIAVHNTTVYVAGDFTMVGGQARLGLAAIGATDGVVTGWNPNPNATNTVSAIAFLANDVVLGGTFTNIGGMAQANLALIDGTAGTLKTWAPVVNDAVNAIATNTAGDTFYIGGRFRQVAGMTRDRLAALTGAAGTAATLAPWNPGANNAVTQVSLASNTVYIAGSFTALGPDPGDTPRPGGLAAIDAGGTGAIKDWNPMITPAPSVTTLAASADTVYLAGVLTSIGGTPRSGTAAVTSGGTGTLASWNPNPDGVVEGFAFVGDSVVMVGQYRGLGGIERKHLVAYEANGEVSTTWNPGVDHTTPAMNNPVSVYALATSGTTVYVGGVFNRLGTQMRNNVGAVAENGTVDATWNPDADNNVYALAVDGSTVYVGGAITTIGTQPRAAIAAVGAVPGSGTPPTSWNPGANNVVRAIAVVSSGPNAAVYAGGDFTTFGSGAPAPTRNHLAATDIGNSAANTWDPNVTGTTVNALVMSMNGVVAGGNFTQIGGVARTNLAQIDPAGAATAFTPNPDGIVYALLINTGALYVGGAYFNIAATGRGHLAGFDAAGALSITFIYNYDVAVRALSVGGGNIYVGGDFTTRNAGYVSGFDKVPALP